MACAADTYIAPDDYNMWEEVLYDIWLTMVISKDRSIYR